MKQTSVCVLCDWFISKSTSKDNVERWMSKDSRYARSTERGYKPTETCQYTHFNSCHPPGVEKRFCQRRSTGFLEQTLQNSHLNLDRTLKISKRSLHREATQSNSRRDSLRTIKHEDRKEALKQKTGTHKKLLPFFKQFQPSLPKFEKHTYRQKALNTKPAITRTFIWVVTISRIPTDRQKNPRS